MKREEYEYAKQYLEDIDAIDAQLREVEIKGNWITTSTPNRDNGALSLRFRDDLVNWLKETRDKYWDEFEKL